jgi:hypothetical protein
MRQCMWVWLECSLADMDPRYRVPSFARHTDNPLSPSLPAYARTSSTDTVKPGPAQGLQHAYGTGAATRRSRRSLGAMNPHHAVLVGSSLALIGACTRCSIWPRPASNSRGATMRHLLHTAPKDPPCRCWTRLGQHSRVSTDAGSLGRCSDRLHQDWRARPWQGTRARECGRDGQNTMRSEYYLVAAASCFGDYVAACSTSSGAL